MAAALGQLFRVDFSVELGFIAAMIRATGFMKYWLPVAIWMMVIFSASSDRQSGERSSRYLGPLVRWLVPGISEPALDKSVAVLRKVAHVLEYAVLSVLLWRARRGNPDPLQPQWNKAHARFALFVSALYALTDEIHQAFVPNRGPNFWDICLDTAGATFGLWLVWLYFRFKQAERK